MRDWETGANLDDVVEETDGGVVWSTDAKSFFYVKLDDNHRPMQVWRHRLGTKQTDDALVYEEKDSGWFTHLHESSSGRFCVIAGGDHETSEQRLIDLANPEAPARLVAAREEACNIRSPTAATSCSFSPMKAGRHRFQGRDRTTRRSRPRQMARPDPVSGGIYILDVELYAGHMVRLERANALPAIIIRDLANAEEHAIAFDEAAYSLDTMGGYEFETTNLRFSYSSMTTPSEVYDYDMAARTRVLRKRQEIPSGPRPGRLRHHAHHGDLA